MSKTKVDKPAFESTLCGRCNGSGKFSYSSFYGRQCFGCHGLGHQLTKRGAAAQQWFSDRLTIPARDVTPGQRVRIEAITMSGRVSGRVTVASVKFDNDGAGSIEITTADNKTFYLAGETVQLVPTQVQRAALIELALAYQDTLTKAGTPRKRKPTTTTTGE